MDAFVIEIAGLAVAVQPMFASTMEYCRSFLTDREPEAFVEVTEADLAYEQEMAEKEAIEEGIRIRKYQGPHLERAAIQRKIALELLDRDTILLHGSTVAVDGAAYLFTAPCGTGKSTHTRLWREVFGDRAVMVNDDKPFLRITSSGVLAYGSPWCGKHGLGGNVCFPLKGICFLRRGPENRIHPAKPEDVLKELRHQCFTPEDPTRRETALALTDRLMQEVALWEMECTKESEAAVVSHRAMSGFGD